MFLLNMLVKKPPFPYIDKPASAALASLFVLPEQWVCLPALICHHLIEHPHEMQNQDLNLFHLLILLLIMPQTECQDSLPQIDAFQGE